MPLKTVGDAMHIRNLVLRRIARIELEQERDAQAPRSLRRDRRRVLGRGNRWGLVDCLQGVRRYYPRVASDELMVTLLQDQPRLLLELPESLARAASSSRPIDRFAVRRGWAVGDCALVRNARDGKFAPPTAQFAVREARCAATNVVASLARQPTGAFDYASRGSMAAIGRHNGIADVLGFALRAVPAWLLWRAYYLSQMPTLGRKLRIFVEWASGMLFPTDITHLRFTRSVDLDDGRDAQARAPATELTSEARTT